MKWIRLCSAIIATLGMAALAEAGITQVGHCGAEKACACAPSHQPVCCQPKICYKPVICRPTCPSVHGYQRQCLKPCNYGQCAAPQGCAPAPAGCAPAPAPACAAPAPACAAPAPACAPAPAPACAAPAPACAAPAPVCAAPAPACAAPAPTCAAPSAGCCPSAGCGPARCCNADPCEIAHWIYVSQTACYAKDRRKAIRKLGNRFDCVCNPEIMCAFAYALNDADERVRSEAADEIGDQIRKNGCCCCTQSVVTALMAALGDCDKKVRKQAEEALELCGYEVGDCCNLACGGVPGCGACGAAQAPAQGPARMPMEETAPAPAPPPEPEAYFPSRIRDQQTRKSTTRNSLANLFGLVD